MNGREKGGPLSAFDRPGPFRRSASNAAGKWVETHTVSNTPRPGGSGWSVGSARLPLAAQAGTGRRAQVRACRRTTITGHLGSAPRTRRLHPTEPGPERPEPRDSSPRPPS